MGAFEEIYFQGHASRGLAPYVGLHYFRTSDATSPSVYHLSPDHLSEVVPSPQGVGVTQMKWARDVVPGEFISVLGDDGNVIAVRVNRTTRVMLEGAFNPYTMSGSIVVDGVLGTSVSSWMPIIDNHFYPYRVAWIYSLLLAPIRMLYTFAPGFIGRLCDTHATKGPMSDITLRDVAASILYLSTAGRM